MAYKIIDRLRDGDFDCIESVSISQKNRVVSDIRKAPDRIPIIREILSEYIDEYPGFCFEIICDIPEFAEEAFKTFDHKRISVESLNSMLYNSPVGVKLISEKAEELAVVEEYFEIALRYVFDTNNRELMKKLSMYPDLHIRFLFMSHLILRHPEEIKKIYPEDFSKYVTSVSYEKGEQLTFCPKLMDARDISILAIYFLIKNREEDYIKLKDYILANYDYNYLGSELMGSRWIVDPLTHAFTRDDNKELKIEAFNKDADAIFKTSMDFRFPLYLKYRDRINNELIKEFEGKLKYFLEAERDISDYLPLLYNNPTEEELDGVYRNGLGNQLELWAEKYMDNSKSKEIKFLGKGSTCSCYRIGDYVIKLVRFKWSYEDVICPNLYLIAKNYEEILIRNLDGVVVGGLEVQKYLSRTSQGLDPEIFKKFDEELHRLGYKLNDDLIDGPCGDNTLLLDSYRDADYYNPEFLPDWFKKHPLVLIDRDRIYPKDLKYYRQLREE